MGDCTEIQLINTGATAKVKQSGDACDKVAALLLSSLLSFLSLLAAVVFQISFHVFHSFLFL